MEDDPVCPLCLRPIPKNAKQSVHHLVPKLKGGKHGPRVLLHHICHQQIHVHFTETELAQSLNTPDALRKHPKLASFLHWIAKKPADFHTGSLKSLRRRKG